MISAVIPFFNNHSVIEKCLKPLFLFQEIDEIIVVDDNSTSPLSMTHPKLKIIRNDKNCGPGYGRNVGAKMAKNKLIYFIDSDVVVSQRSLVLSRQLLEQDECDIVIGKVGNVFYKNFYSYYKNFYIHSQLGRFDDCQVDFIYGGFCAVKSPLLWPVDMRYAEDNYLGKLVSDKKRIFLSKEVEFIHLKEYSFLSLLKYDFKVAFGMARVLLLKNTFDLKFSHSNPSQLISLFLLAFFWIGVAFQLNYLLPIIVLLWFFINKNFFSEMNAKTPLSSWKIIGTTFFGQNAQGWGAFFGMMYYGVKNKIN